VSIRSPPKT